MTITKRIVVDEQGNPKEVVIPYAEFVEISEMLGLDLSEGEQTELREALKDSQDGAEGAFVAADDL